MIGIVTGTYLLGLFAGANLFYGLLLNLTGIYFILRAYTLPEQKITFDRQNGLFTYPGFAWSKAVTIPFHDAVVAITSSNSGTVPGPPQLTAYHPNGITGAELSSYMQIQSWWLFVWYMDKNRPLPPGSAFDPYREKDFERRKAEGFPAPLYKSIVDTPEANPVHQLERERRWKERITYVG